MPNLRDYHIFISHSWAYSEDYETICDWFQEATNFKFSDFSVPMFKPLTAKGDNDLKAKLRQQIASCSCVLVICGMYVNYSEWIDFEIATAVELKKHIIGIEPWKQERVPTKVQDAIRKAGGKMVGWNPTSVVQAVRDYALER